MSRKKKPKNRPVCKKSRDIGLINYYGNCTLLVMGACSQLSLLYFNFGDNGSGAKVKKTMKKLERSNAVPRHLLFPFPWLTRRQQSLTKRFGKESCGIED